MKDTIAYFNQYLINNLPYTYPTQISLGQPLDYENLTEYINISWRGSDETKSLTIDRKSADCHIECFSRDANVYAHQKMADEVLNVLDRLINVQSFKVRLGTVNVNFMELEGGIKKADILFTIKKDEVI